jgi:1,4-dihydroxy-2-naphthoate octaprenyltransferase
MTPQVAAGWFGVWWLAIRPKTLPAAASGVIIGSALAWRDGGFGFGPALAAFAIAVLLQVASNLANDVYDDERGADTADRLGPTRVTHSGLLQRSQVKRGLAVVLVIAVALGVYLAFVRGPMVLVIGAAAIVSAVAYTGGPYPLGYHGLGEVFVFLFFGLASVVGTYWVQTGETRPLVWLMAIPPGLIITGILVVNNLRDIEQDRLANKRTIAVRIGAQGARAEYAACIVGAYAIVPVLVAIGMLPAAALATWLSLPLAAKTTLVVCTREGRPLNAALASTGQVALLFGVLFAIGLALA